MKTKGTEQEEFKKCDRSSTEMDFTSVAQKSLWAIRHACTACKHTYTTWKPTKSFLNGLNVLKYIYVIKFFL